MAGERVDVDGVDLTKALPTLMQRALYSARTGSSNASRQGILLLSS